MMGFRCNPSFGVCCVRSFPELCALAHTFAVPLLSGVVTISMSFAHARLIASAPPESKLEAGSNDTGAISNTTSIGPSNWTWL